MALNLIGLTGPAGSGKDTVADFLVARHGYTKLAFADKLRAEICDAYNVPEQLLLKRETKKTLRCTGWHWCIAGTTFSSTGFWNAGSRAMSNTALHARS